MLAAMVCTWLMPGREHGALLVRVGWEVLVPCAVIGCACAKCQALREVALEGAKANVQCTLLVLQSSLAPGGSVPVHCKVLGWNRVEKWLSIGKQHLQALANAVKKDAIPMLLLSDASVEARRAAYAAQGMVRISDTHMQPPVGDAVGQGWRTVLADGANSALPSPPLEDTNVFEDGMLCLRGHQVI